MKETLEAINQMRAAGASFLPRAGSNLTMWSADSWKESMDKSKMRSKLAALSFTEKVRILEKLRDRDKAIAAAGLRRKPEAAKLVEKNKN